MQSRGANAKDSIVSLQYSEQTIPPLLFLCFFARCCFFRLASAAGQTMAARARLAVVVLASALVAGAALGRARTTRPRSPRPGNATARGTSRRFVSRHPSRARRVGTRCPSRRTGVRTTPLLRHRPRAIPRNPRNAKKEARAQESARLGNTRRGGAVRVRPSPPRVRARRQPRAPSACGRLRVRLEAASALSRFTQGAALALLCAVLATVAERFFCPALANIARWLGLSDDVAGTAAALLREHSGASLHKSRRAERRAPRA